MSIEQQIADLTTATTNLLDAVNVRKSALDERVETAGDFANAAQMSANAAAASVTDANQAAGEAAGSAAQALAIYGTAAAQQSAVIAAQAAASLAEGYAAAASSVVQQDLSGVTAAALHRSPNAVRAMFVYDTSKDSDGGAWTEKCQHTSWYNEPINGKWLGAQESEAAARAVSGAATGDYFQRTTDGKFYKLNDTSGITEVFRGNKRDFPRLAGIVAEASSVTIYDLTEPGRPMAFRFIRGSSGSVATHLSGSTTSVNSASALNGQIALGLGPLGFARIDFLRDAADWKTLSSSTIRPGNIAQRNVEFTTNGLTSGSVIASSTVNAVAMTVLPDAPVDPVTGLKVPTIAVATNGGLSFIKHNGSVATISDTFYGIFVEVAFEKRGTIIAKHISAAPYFNRLTRFFKVPDVGFSMTAGAVGANGYTIGTSLMRVANSGGATNLIPNALRSDGFVSIYKENVASGARGAVSTLTNTFNTGHQPGDIRRTYLSDNVVESVGPSTELVTNGTFDTDSGWTKTGSATISSGACQLGNGSAGTVYQDITFVPGKSYRVTITVAYTTGRCEIDTTTSGGTRVDYLSLPPTTGTTTFLFTAQGSAARLRISTRDSSVPVVSIDNISVKEVVGDRSYKAQGASITGTLIKSAVASNAQLVAYSGFSAANYLREPYSADLDLGTGEWSVGAWVKPIGRYNLLYNTEFLNESTFTTFQATATQTDIDAPLTGKAWLVKSVEAPTSTERSIKSVQQLSSGVAYKCACYVKKYQNYNLIRFINSSIIGGGTFIFDLDTATITSGPSGTISNVQLTPLFDGWVKVEFTSTPTATTNNYIFWVSVVSSLEDNQSGFYVAHPDVRSLVDAEKTPLYQQVNTDIDYDGSTGVIAHRAGTTGPEIKLGFDGGLIKATAFDGTTTRTVTTSGTYNTDTWVKPEAIYTPDGALAIRVNGVEVAKTTGAPLLTLSNPDAVLTIGNSYALDAPFPGSIALLKLSATVPTAEQSVWMYEQEKQLFREGAQCCLPDSGTILDLAYDDATDKWIAVSAANESEWSGLVRTNVTPVPAGSYTKAAAASGVQLLARSTTNPGVDITIPAYGLREELVKRAEAAAQRSKEIVTFDFDAAEGQAEFALPVGYATKAVYVDGAAKRRGSTKDFTLLFDGFKETVAFAVAPAPAAWVQIHAIKE